MGLSELLAMSSEVPLSARTLLSLLSVFQKEIQLHRIYSEHIFLEFKTREGCCASFLEDGEYCGEARLVQAAGMCLSVPTEAQ